MISSAGDRQLARVFTVISTFLVSFLYANLALPNTMSSRLLHDYPSLASYSEEQLKDLLTNDELLDVFLYSLPAVQGVLEHQQQLSKANDELASE